MSDESDLRAVYARTAMAAIRLDHHVQTIPLEEDRFLIVRPCNDGTVDLYLVSVEFAHVKAVS